VNHTEVLDSHHHVWDTHHLHYELFDEVTALNRPYRVEDFELAAAALDVRSSICVEAASAGADGRRETEWLLGHIAGSRRISALVAWAPLDRTDIDDHLDWLVTLPSTKPVVGVRRSFEFEDADFPGRASVAAGARAVGARGLVVDLVLFARSLPKTITLVDGCPETQFVLDHIGKPPIRSGEFQPWADHIAELSGRPNVACKLSGLPNEADRDRWTTGDLRPYVEHAIAVFGYERVLYGSDWPVVNLAGGLPAWFYAVGTLLEQLSEVERKAILGGNAARIYGV